MESRPFLPGGDKKRKRWMHLLDVTISIHVIAPLVVFFWRGTWGLMDLKVALIPVYPSFLFALAVFVSFSMIRERFHETYARKKRYADTWIILKVCSRVYTYVFAVVCILQWHSLWAMLDGWLGITYTPDGRTDGNTNVPMVYLVLAASTLALAVLKSVRNVIGVPFFVLLDRKDTILFPTRFRRKMVQKTSLYILDCLFSVLVVGTLVVFVWRGAWVLIDIYLFPEDEHWSAWASLVLGYTAVAVAFLLQPVMRWLCDRIDGALRLFVADIFLLFSLFGTVNVWRGIWNLLNLYFLPDDMELSCWITHWVSLVLLILLGCSNSLLVRGVYIDAEEPAGKCVVFPCYYLRLIFKQERQQKMGNVTLEAMSKRMVDIERNSDANHMPDGANHI